MKKDKHYKTGEFARRIFKVFATVENKEFEESLADEKRVWRKKDAIDFDVDILMANMLSTYNNIVAEGEWKTTKSKDSKLIALTTEVENLQKQLTTVQNESKQATSSGNNFRSNNDYVIDDWRKKKTEGDETSRDGKKYWWCPHHKNDEKGYPNGRMDCTSHTPLPTVE